MQVRVGFQSRIKLAAENFLHRYGAAAQGLQLPGRYYGGPAGKFGSYPQLPVQESLQEGQADQEREGQGPGPTNHDGVREISAEQSAR